MPILGKLGMRWENSACTPYTFTSYGHVYGYIFRQWENQEETDAYTGRTGTETLNRQI